MADSISHHTAPGSQGYAEAAPLLAQQYESIRFEDVHGDVLPFFPAPPCRALDIGAGSGRDAAALARRGYTVTATEPTQPLRELGCEIHRDLPIRWLGDALPGLPMLRGEGARFGLVLLTAVWMHLDEAERHAAMAAVAELLAPGGVVSMSLRHGPVPPGRRMFDVSAEETAALAAAHGLGTVYSGRRGDAQGREDVHWSFVVFGKPAA